MNINCISNGPKSWFKDNEKVSSSILKAGNIYIDKVFETDSGIYSCEGSTADGQSFKVDSTLLVAGKCLYFVQDTLHCVPFWAPGGKRIGTVVPNYYYTPEPKWIRIRR